MAVPTQTERAAILDWLFDHQDDDRKSAIAECCTLFSISRINAASLYREMTASTTTTKHEIPVAPIADPEPAPYNGKTLPEISNKQKLFVAAYLGRAKCNASEAARLAGYATPPVDGCRLLINANVKAHIDAGLESVLMGPSETLKRLGDMARGDYSEWVNQSGEIDISLGVNKGLGHLVESYTTRDSERGSSVTLKLYSAQVALTTIAKHHGLLVDKTEVTGKDGGAIKVEPAPSLETTLALIAEAVASAVG